jgi:hypothetical protein
MLAIGRTGYVTAKVLFTIQTAASMKAIGFRISRRATVFSLLKTAQSMKVHSSKTVWLIESSLNDLKAQLLKKEKMVNLPLGPKQVWQLKKRSSKTHSRSLLTSQI